MAQHVLPKRTYYLIFATLILLTLVTVDVAFFNIGLLNFPLAMLIATCKATLVILYFMHVRYSGRLTWLVLGAGFLFLLILIAITLSDYLTRGWLTLPSGF
jgi:cytochrome c oxidase subunit 4